MRSRYDSSLSSQDELPGAIFLATSCKQVDNSVRSALVFSWSEDSVQWPKARMCISLVRKGVVVGFGADVAGRRGELMGAIRGDPLIGRYFGVELPAVGRSRGDDGRDRTPLPLGPGLLSKTLRKARELEELWRA